MKKKAPALEIVYRATDSLHPDPLNSNTHPADQLQQLRASIREYGLNKPILLKDDEKTIGAGHGVWEAAKLEGFKEVPTVTIRGLSADKWRAFAIADNRIARNSMWNLEVLVGELNALHGLGFHLGDMGFGSIELGTIGVEGFTLPEKLAAAEETPPPPKKAVVKLGEIWLLGDHRLLIGDSTDKAAIGRLLAGESPHLMVTDPPYGVKYDPNWRNETGIAEDGSLQRIKTGKVRKSIGAKAVGKVSNDHRADWSEAWALFPGDVAYVWHADRFASSVDLSLQSAGFAVRAQIIWNKMRMIIGRGDYHFSHEPCWYTVRKGKTGHWAGDRKQTTIWDISHRASETGHGTQKPIECMRRPIMNNSKPGDGVYDPFVGSGTTLIACHMEGRRCFAVEIDPVYAQLVIERWEGFADATAKREDGATLAQIKKGKKK